MTTFVQQTASYTAAVLAIALKSCNQKNQENDTSVLISNLGAAPSWGLTGRTWVLPIPGLREPRVHRQNRAMKRVSYRW